MMTIQMIAVLFTQIDQSCGGAVNYRPTTKDPIFAFEAGWSLLVPEKKSHNTCYL